MCSGAVARETNVLLTGLARGSAGRTGRGREGRPLTPSTPSGTALFLPSHTAPHTHRTTHTQVRTEVGVRVCVGSARLIAPAQCSRTPENCTASLLHYSISRLLPEGRKMAPLGVVLTGKTPSPLRGRVSFPRPVPCRPFPLQTGANKALSLRPSRWGRCEPSGHASAPFQLSLNA